MSDPDEANPFLLELADQSTRRVLKATWAGTAREGADYYCAELDCGHHMHVSESSLHSPLMCLSCLKQKIGEAIPRDDD